MLRNITRGTICPSHGRKTPKMKVVLDVDYRDGDAYAVASAIAFKDWSDSSPLETVSIKISPVAPYEPGSFYKRELPCLLKALTALSARRSEAISEIVVDSYVTLGPNHPGLGYKLYEAFNKTIPVIGVAKTHFKDAEAVQVLRGQSLSPLYVTAVGTDTVIAANNIRHMHGLFRIPTLLKTVDQTCRTAFTKGVSKS